MGGRRSVWKDVAQMAPATAAMHLGPHHTVALIQGGLDRTCKGIVETRPAGAAVEFFGRHEKTLSAARTNKCAGTFFMIEGAASRSLRAMRAHHPILFRAKQAAPFLVGAAHFKRLALHGHILRYGTSPRNYLLWSRRLKQSDRLAETQPPRRRCPRQHYPPRARAWRARSYRKCR